MSVETSRRPDALARVGVVTAIVTNASAGALLLAAEAMNFVRGCANENVLRSAMGFQEATLLECAQEGFEWSIKFMEYFPLDQLTKIGGGA